MVGECAMQREGGGGQVEVFLRRFQGLLLSVSSICH